MDKLTMMVQLEFEQDLFFDNSDEDQRDWFFNNVLGDNLHLYSQEIGDHIGKIVVHETGDDLGLMPNITDLIEQNKEMVSALRYIANRLDYEHFMLEPEDTIASSNRAYAALAKVGQ